MSAPERISLSPEQEKNIDARLARIEGHVRSIRRMLADHEDCDSLLVQMLAVKAAMNQVIVKVLEAQIESSIGACANETEREQALEDVKHALAMVLRRS
nr:metal-sensing transcriptional repressor [Ardenticatena sp.]